MSDVHVAATALPNDHNLFSLSPRWCWLLLYRWILSFFLLFL